MPFRTWVGKRHKSLRKQGGGAIALLGFKKSYSGHSSRLKRHCGKDWNHPLKVNLRPIKRKTPEGNMNTEMGYSGRVSRLRSVQWITCYNKLSVNSVVTSQYLYVRGGANEEVGGVHSLLVTFRNEARASMV